MFINVQCSEWRSFQLRTQRLVEIVEWVYEWAKMHTTDITIDLSNFLRIYLLRLAAFTAGFLKSLSFLISFFLNLYGAMLVSCFYWMRLYDGLWQVSADSPSRSLYTEALQIKPQTYCITSAPWYCLCLCSLWFFWTDHHFKRHHLVLHFTKVNKLSIKSQTTINTMAATYFWPFNLFAYLFH